MKLMTITKTKILTKQKVALAVGVSALGIAGYLAAGAIIDVASTTITQQKWVIVITNRGTPLPDEAVNFICGQVKQNVVSWIKREANRYQQIKPFNNIVCLRDQILLSGDSLTGGQFSGPEGTITSPLNDTAVVKFIEQKIPSLAGAKYVTVFHYIPYESQFYQHMYSSKYDFIFIKTPNKDIPFYPELNVNYFGEELIHEFMHKIGATDKYSSTPQQACRIDPTTGQQYDGYDIMCHRVPATNGGFTTPTLTELKVTESTAREINWLAITPALSANAQKLDYDNNGKLDQSDAAVLVDVFLRKRSCSTGKICDVNQNGKITIADLVKFVRIYQGLDSPPDF